MLKKLLKKLLKKQPLLKYNLFLKTILQDADCPIKALADHIRPSEPFVLQNILSVRVKYMKREIQRTAEQQQLLLILMPQRHSTCFQFYKMVQLYHFEQILEDSLTCFTGKKLFRLSISILSCLYKLIIRNNSFTSENQR